MIDLIPDDTRKLKAWRKEVRGFLEEALPHGMRWDYDYNEDEAEWKKALEFWRKVGQKGWVAATWPKEYYGQERTPIEKWILAEEFANYDAPAYPVIGMAVATAILRHGTPEQRKFHLKGIAEATTMWGEGYTEPSAGSDLAVLTTRAHWDEGTNGEGPAWVINGQKTFGTAGHWCQWMIVLARTDPNVPKHAGISCFLVPLDSKGISMTPLYNVAGGRQNHTFFDNVRVPAESLLGTVNKAWEQVWFGMGGDKLDRTGPFIGDWGYRIMSHMKRTVRYCKETMRDGKPISEDQIVRQQLGDLLLIEEGIRMLWYEDFSNFINKKASPFGAAGRPFQQLVYKEYWPKMMQTLMEIVGPLAQIQGGPQSSKWAQLNGDIQYVYRCAFGNHAGGTSQLKRMVVATRGLGLPR